MKPGTPKRQTWLLLGLMLALPAAQAKNPHNDGADAQRTERAVPYRGKGQPQRDERRYAPQYERRYAPQPRYDNRDDRSYDNGYDRGYAPAPRYEPEPRYAPRGMNLSEAVSEAERMTGGRVLSAEPLDDGGQPYYRIKVLTPNGRVKVLFIDAH